MEENKIDKEEETKKIEDQKSKKNDLIFSQLTDLQYNDFKTNFDKYDADGSGEIDPDELILEVFDQITLLVISTNNLTINFYNNKCKNYQEWLILVKNSI